MSSEAALRFAAEHGVEFVDVRFTDLLGQWRHLTIPIEEFGLDAFENGVGFDASSLRGWAAINESDMLLIPDAIRTACGAEPLSACRDGNQHTF